MTEAELREKLARVDSLRAEAKVASDMNAHWLGHDGELVTVQTVTVRRRWRGDKTLHSEVVMTAPERALFLDWLYERGQLKSRMADALASEIERGE